MVSLPDPVLIEVPAGTPVEPTAPVDRPIDTPTRTFQVESPDGDYSVTGKVIRLDVAAADPYMVVLADDRTATRIRLREDHERGSRSWMPR